MDKSESVKELAIAMCKAQGEMGGAHKGADNPFFKSKYADLGSVVEAIKQPFATNGLSYIQFPIEEGGRIGVETVIMHKSGEWLSNKFTVQLTKQDAQGAGSAITYCRRYGLQSIAGIPSEDDDGNAASTPEQGNQQITNMEAQANWYDDFEAHKSNMIKKIQSGEQTAQGIIDALRKSGLAVSKKTQQQILELK